jgi:hypothetical protein
MRHGVRRIERLAVHLNRNLSAKIISMSGIKGCGTDSAPNFAKLRTKGATRIARAAHVHDLNQETPR